MRIFLITDLILELFCPCVACRGEARQSVDGSVANIFLNPFSAPFASLPAQPVQLNALFYKFGAYLTGMKSPLHLFHRGGETIIFDGFQWDHINEQSVDT